MNDKFVAVSKIKRQRHFCPISSNSLDKIVRENRMSNLIGYTRKQSYTYQVLQTIQMKLMLLFVWAEPAVLGSAKTALRLI